MACVANLPGQLDSTRVRVLLVDDNEPFRHVVAGFLQRQEQLIVVGVIRGGEEALQKAQGLEAQVVLVGLEGPGLGTICRLRNMMPAVAIIALTSLEGDACRETVLAVGADEVIPKPEVVARLLSAIQQIAQGNRSS